MKISSQVGSETEAAGPDLSNQLKKIDNSNLSRTYESQIWSPKRLPGWLLGLNPNQSFEFFVFLHSTRKMCRLFSDQRPNF